MGTAPGVFGLASSGLGADLGPKSMISGRILNSFRGLFSSGTLITLRPGTLIKLPSGISNCGVLAPRATLHSTGFSEIVWASDFGPILADFGVRDDPQIIFGRFGADFGRKHIAYGTKTSPKVICGSSQGWGWFYGRVHIGLA